MNRNILMPIMISMTSYYHNSNPPRRTHPVLYNNFKSGFFILVIFTALILSSCTEKSTIFGTGLLPGSDFVNVRGNNSISVYSYTNYTDSVKSSNSSYLYLGGLHDPYFGDVTTDFVAQLRLAKKYDATELPVVDSTKLFMTFAGAKGELGIPRAIKLFETTKMLYIDSTYYSNRDPGLLIPLGVFNLPVINKDTILNINVPLDTVGKYLMRDITKLNQEGTVTDWRKFFNGLYVTFTDPLGSGEKSKGSSESTLMAIQIGTSSFYIRAYYHTYVASGLYFDFLININSARYNRYSHNFTAADPVKKIKHLNDGIKDTLSYLEGFNGAFTKLTLPSLAQYKDSGKVSVNKARITVPVYFDNINYKVDTVPSQIYLSFVGKDGKKYMVSDYNISPSFFGGTYSTNTKSYSFNISSFAQEYLEGKIPSPELEMYFPEGQFQNVILRANTSSKPVKFEFTYTKF
jgi:hypothetical protein